MNVITIYPGPAGWGAIDGSLGVLAGDSIDFSFSGGEMPPGMVVADTNPANTQHGNQGYPTFVNIPSTNSPVTIFCNGGSHRYWSVVVSTPDFQYNYIGKINMQSSTGAFPVGSKITMNNYGTIIGAAGADGGVYSVSGSNGSGGYVEYQTTSSSSQPGGPAFQAAYPITINNYGTICGGPGNNDGTAQGPAVTGNSNITWGVTGNIIGAVT